MEAQNSKDNQSNPEQKNLLEAPSHRPQVPRQSHCERNSTVMAAEQTREHGAQTRMQAAPVPSSLVTMPASIH